ncbi:MAG: M48 family metalloprotease [Stellaceae bacterium]
MEAFVVVLRIFSWLLCVLLASSAVLVRHAIAQDGTAILRDAEIESIIRTYATPIWRVAGLDPDAVHVYIVEDPTLNSFVAGGQNLFLNSGTILRSETPNQLIGIMAHETGHIAGGHLSRSDEALRNATIESIVAMVVGAAAAVASRDPGAASAAMLGGQSVAQRSFLQFSVTQEASADQAALSFLDRTQQSARGLLQFFEILQQQELLSAARQDPYLRTHPLTAQRVEYVREHVAHSRFSDRKDPPEWIALHQRMKAKLAAFLSPPSQALAAIKPDDNSVAARYGRAIAYYRLPDLKHAVPIIDGLIHDYPQDPYFHELKGQMLFENGRIGEAVAPYEQAVKLKPDSALLRMECAQVQLETNEPALVPKALANLNDAVRFEDRNPDAWRFLAIAQGRSNNIGMMALALAEEGISEGDYKSAHQQAERATKLLPPGPAKQRALDIADEARRVGRL